MNAVASPPGTDDVSTLAWVHGELRRSLEAAHKALRRYLKESETLGESDVDVVDPSVLRSARAHLHQGVGALELVGQPAPAQVLRASEAAVQRLAAKPKLLDAKAVETIERTSFALLDYLARVLAGKSVSPVALFPQYRAAQTLAGADRIHPADLWQGSTDWHELPVDPTASPRRADDEARSLMETQVLALMRQPDPRTLGAMSQLCAELAAGADQGGSGSRLATLWQLASAFFEAQANGLLANDVYSKRVASRLLAQLRASVKGREEPSDRLGHDLLFFCSHAKKPGAASPSPRLELVRRNWKFDDSAEIDYETPRLGRHDPAQLAQAKKRVAGAKDTWSAVAGGELHRLNGLGEQFALVGDSLQRLFPSGEVLAGSLQAAVAQTLASGDSPPPQLAMEVATSILYLDASLEDGELDQPQLGERVQRLARRIDDVRVGAEAQPLENWMEELYRRVSDRQTMGSVVQELRTTLSEVEKQIDQYFRDPSQRQMLIPVPNQLSAMRGVLSVLGLDQASLAVLRMRDDIDALAETEVDPQRAVQAGTFDRLADNLGALSFLIDMLSVQPALAKSLFRFDPDTGNLTAVMGQSERPSAFASFDATAPLEAAPSTVSPTLAPELPPAPPPPPARPALAPTPAASSGLEDDAEMREVFIDEAREVIAGARASLDKLIDTPDDLGEMTSIRRAFHTLKGSSRMVGLKDFGEAAWGCEQLYNTRLAQSARMDTPLRQLTAEALDYLDSWTEAVASGQASGHQAAAVSRAADALRLENHRMPIPAPGSPLPTVDETTPISAVTIALPPPAAPQPPPPPLPVLEPLTDLVPDLPEAVDLDLGFAPPPAAPAEPLPSAEAVEFELDLGQFDAQDTQVPEDAVLPQPEVEPLDSLLPDLDFGDLVAPPQAAPEVPAETVEARAAEAFEALPELPVEPAESDELPPLHEAPPPVESLFGALPPGPADDGLPDLPLDELAAPEAAPPPAEAEALEEEPYKVVGPLRISIPLFNIFLNEADELSRRLGIEIGEWSIDFERHPVSETGVALAHSLAGNSATVGYSELSALARSLEHALMRSRSFGRGRAGEPELFAEAAEEIRRLLHQFAAGFLRPVEPGLMERLADHERWPAPPPRVEPLTPSEMRPFAPSSRALPLDMGPPDEEEEIDAVDAIDAELFPIFEDEADELLPQLQSRLRDWADRPADREAASACMRTLHTFKGGARLAGAMRVGEMAHRLETAIEYLLAQGRVEPWDVDPLLGRVDTMVAAFEALRRPAAAAAPEAAVPEAAAPVAEAAPPPVEAVPPVEAAPAAPAETPAAPRRADALEPLPALIDWTRFSSAPATAAPLAEKPAAAGSAVVRVRGGLLDRLVNQAGEVSITRARLESDVRQLQSSLNELTDSLDRLRRQLRDIELQAETQMTSRMEAAKASSASFDPLEMDRFTRFQELTRFMAESVNDVATLQRSLQRTLQSAEDELAAQARITRELQDDLLRTRMVEFESMADRLYRVVRQAAKDTGKQVRLDIVGGAIEIDRGVLERMTGPFEHLLRNSVVHGIESPEQRGAAGKDKTGSITITLTQEGNEVGVEVRDDGAGLDFARIRERAVSRGLLAADAPVSEGELAQMIFAPGFTTASSVTELAGRGVGMDVVRSEVNAMGGRIETASTPGRGTAFRLLLPLTTAVTQVVMLRSGELQVAVPSSLVEIVRRVKTDEIERAYATGVYEFADELVPFFWMAALLQAGTRGATSGRSQPVVVIRSAAQRVALHVDEVVGNQEVVVKNVGPQLARLPGLAGVTLLPSGQVALIYNPVALATLYGPSARERMVAPPLPADAAQVADQPPAAEAAAAQLAPMVMVVDDSLTVRRVTQRLLVREGYRVVTAKDGLEALERLAEERPAVLLSDIEMPRMDGFDLVRNVRADARMNGLPVIMITSRIAQKHRDYAAELGVDHYLGKPYAEEELLSLVARYAGADIPT